MDAGFKEVLMEASKIKSAQLKVRPGRQAWEGAPEFFKMTAFDADPDTLAARKGNLQGKVAHASKLKERGNEAYTKDPAEALSLYVKAIAVFMWFDRGADKSGEDIPLVNSLDADSPGLKGVPETELEEAQMVASACFSNAALCLMQQGNKHDAIYASSKALELDPFNVKALYRRALAYQSKGSTADLECCVSDLRKAQALEPSNGQVREALTKFQAELREQNRKDRETFGGMFKGGSRLYGEEGLPGPSGGRPGIEMLDDEDEGDAGFVKKDPVVAKLAEADQALRKMQRGVMRAKANSMARQHGQDPMSLLRGERPQNSFVRTLSNVPWWGWLLILLHLCYRIWKITSATTTHHREYREIQRAAPDAGEL